MKNYYALPVLLWLALPLATQAGEGHDHGEAPAATGGPALPRFSAVSETFELVGVINGTNVTLYLDRTDNNAPVKDAKLELEIGGNKIAVTQHGEGEYEATVSNLPKTGQLPVSATVIAGNETDLLAGELDLHTDSNSTSAHAHSWKEYALWTGIAAVALGALGWAVRRRKASNSNFGGGV